MQLITMEKLVGTCRVVHLGRNENRPKNEELK